MLPDNSCNRTWKIFLWFRGFPPLQQVDQEAFYIYQRKKSNNYSFEKMVTFKNRPCPSNVSIYSNLNIKVTCSGLYHKKGLHIISNKCSEKITIFKSYPLGKSFCCWFGNAMNNDTEFLFVWGKVYSASRLGWNETEPKPVSWRQRCQISVCYTVKVGQGF